MKSAPSSSWPLDRGDEPVAGAASTDHSSSAPVPPIHDPAARMCGQPGAAASPIADAEAERPPSAVDRVVADRRADVAGPAHAGAGHQLGVARGDREERSRRSPRRARSSAIRPAASGGCGRRPCPGRSSRRRRRRPRARRRPASSSPSVGRIHAIRSPSTRTLIAELEPVAPAVGQGGVAVQDPAAVGRSVTVRRA